MKKQSELLVDLVYTGICDKLKLVNHEAMFEPPGIILLHNTTYQFEVGLIYYDIKSSYYLYICSWTVPFIMGYSPVYRGAEGPIWVQWVSFY